MIDNLVRRWNALRAASRAMIEGPVPKWPWDREGGDFLADQRRRDHVQAMGMRLADAWREHGEAIAALVERRPDAFPEMHVVNKDGGRPNPRAYMSSPIVMPRLVALAAAKEERP